MKNTMIGRTVKTTHVSGFYFTDSGTTENFSLDLSGNYNSYSRIFKQVREILGEDRIVIDDYNTDSAYYTMPVEKFMEYATCTSK